MTALATPSLTADEASQPVDSGQAPQNQASAKLDASAATNPCSVEIQPLQSLEIPEAMDDQKPSAPVVSDAAPPQLQTPASTSEALPSNPIYAVPTTVASSEQPKHPTAPSSPVAPHLRIPQYFHARSERVGYWLQNAQWPKSEFEADPAMGKPKGKRGRSEPELPTESSSGPTADDGPLPTPSDRIKHTKPYSSLAYESALIEKLCFLDDSEVGPEAAEIAACEALFENRWQPPTGSLFDDDAWMQTCKAIASQNETRIVRDVMPLLVPSAENLTILGQASLPFVKEYTNAGWDRCMPFEGTRPQPDYGVGFRRTAFDKEHVKKLNDVYQVKSQFSVAELMLFPFLTVEAKCQSRTLDEADRQNAHSMVVALRTLVSLARRVNRMQELNRKILCFSVSHNHDSVRIYGHYVEIDGLELSYYRHQLRRYGIFENNASQRWTCYQFIRNVYDVFVPKQRQRINDLLKLYTGPEQALPPVAADEVLNNGVPKESAINTTLAAVDRDGVPVADLPPAMLADMIQKLQKQHEDMMTKTTQQIDEINRLADLKVERQQNDAAAQQRFLIEQFEKERQEAREERRELLQALKSAK